MREMSRSLGCFQILPIVNSTTMNTWVESHFLHVVWDSESIFSWTVFISEQDCGSSMSSVLRTILFPKKVKPVYILISNGWDLFPLPSIFSCNVFFFFDVCQLLELRYLIIFIFSTPKIHDVEHFFTCFLVIFLWSSFFGHISSLKKFLFKMNI